MKKHFAATLLLTVLLAPLRAAAPGDPLDPLDADTVNKAIEVLRRDHVRGREIDGDFMTKATLRGLLEGLAPGAELSAGNPPAPEASPFRSEILDERAGYIRLGSLQSENIAQLDAALRDFAAKKLHGVVLDLRATPESDDFDLAAQVAGRFCPAGRELFTLSGPQDGAGRAFVSPGDPLFGGVLVVLIDENTAGAAEALAATLRWNARALLVGTRSSGRCVRFGLVPIGGDRQLRIAVAEARIAGQAVYPRGLRPDIEAPQDPEVRARILSAELEQGAAPFVFEKERAQLNEASLVAGTNPAIDGDEPLAGLFDRPLQRAVDLVAAIRLFRKVD